MNSYVLDNDRLSIWKNVLVPYLLAYLLLYNEIANYEYEENNSARQLVVLFITGFTRLIIIFSFNIFVFYSFR